MDVHSRRALMDATWKRCRQASKAAKTRILDELCETTDFHRKYAIGRIRQVEECRKVKPSIRRRRKPHYGAEVLRVLDTVFHSGENASGTFAFSLNLTDIGSTWVETRTVLGKGEEGILEAFRQMSSVLPFPVKAIDADNGGEFINHHLWRYCDNKKIGFTRSRPYKKDDNAHIEQKNWTHVRKLIGWDRYDTPEAVRTMNDLYANELRLYMNLFQPSVKLIRLERRGSRKTRRYDSPQAPLDRLAAMPGADRAKVKNLLALRAQLNPFELAAVIRRKLDRIWKLRQVRGTPAEKKVAQAPEVEIASTLARALGTTVVNPKSLRNPLQGASLG